MTIKDLLADVLWNDFFTGRVNIIPPLWTLNIDFFGSILTILLLIWIGDKKHRIIMYIFILIIMLKIEMVVYSCFLIGILLADYMRTCKRNHNVSGIILVGLFLGGYPPSCTPTIGIY